ncbi:bifunctional non-homologous end joining protein LigD [Tamaricihabitans halophyticus]|uniref:Bifunctional non-homologous end joining protein LigD n=1 Tax=Tamaricihabitans halophyticus TaxID=1262583 RepID=A0A4R2QYL0_9PSEU|nr:non-homologous end-joining DNA ligase [Tamaricihabitans halophyticus]TCP55340.1 bifunctional non-homologous end joining protein LigD [Tamaricihabitans halophyticus]
MDDAPADRLATYQRKRDFTRTPEPAGDPATGEPATGNRFVVQRHRARRRHYDLRLELNGVLVSWAVPKGPTLDPTARHLAVHVEDHPLEYADFEGIIPSGEYGAGDVIVWDRGTWEPVDTADPAEAIASGNLHFDLHGEKLAGRFVLIRPSRSTEDGKQWLLLKKKTDEHAHPGWDPEDHPRSVKSGRTNQQVAAAPAALWRGDLPANRAEIPLDSGEPDNTPKGKPRKRTAANKKTHGAHARWRPPTEAELADLADLGQAGSWRIAGRDVPLTNLHKTLFPSQDGARAITKRDLIRYHARIAPVLLPYLVDRPLNTHRFPNGVAKPGFWHKAVPEHAPSWLTRWQRPDADRDKAQWYLIADSVPALVWLANYAAVELHPWSSTIADVEQPSWAFFDIDPGTETTFDEVLTLARLHRTALEHLGVTGRPKVTGQRGIQIWVPVAPGYSYAQTREWTQTVSKAIGDTVPDLVSWAWAKDERGGLARLDYTQNVRNKTLVAPYSARPRPGAPVSVPLEWDELDDPNLRPDGWTIDTVLDRIAERGDPFAALLDVEQRLPKLS